jgi:glycosyltransferase involved in cell wall biosynthesis
MTSVLFVHNFVTHYSQRTFELLAKRVKTRFLFFSRGGESYWLPEHGIRTGDFDGRYLRGISVLGTRVVPGLILRLLMDRYDVIVKSIDGRFALLAAFLIARLRRKPFVLWTGVWMKIDTPLHRLLYPLTRFLYRHADAVVAYGSHVKEFLVSQGVVANRVFVTRHAVDNERYSRPVPFEDRDALRRRLGIAPEIRIVLYLGRLEPVKGLEYLVEAFASLRREDAALVIAGTGTERSALEALAARVGVSASVRVPGYVPIDEALAYYSIAWVYVLPSVTMHDHKECWGLVVNEAFNQGVPVIATEAVGAAAGGLVRDGDTGLVVPERDVPSLARALQRLLDSAELRCRLSRNAKAIIKTWDQEHMVDQFEAAIRFALRDKELDS